MLRTHLSRLMLPALFLAIAITGTSHAQFGDADGSGPRLKGSLIDPGLFGGADDGLAGEEYTIDAFVVPGQESSTARLAVRVTLGPDWHIYSISQQHGPALPTKIKLDKSEQYRQLGPFESLEKPVPGKRSTDYPDVPVEEHYDEVTWIAPIELKAGIDPLSVAIKGELDGQVCREVCIPLSFRDSTFTARVGTAEQIASVPAAKTENVKPQAVGEYVSPKGNPIIRGHIEPKVVAPGQTAKLVLTVEPLPDWHVYLRAGEVPNPATYRPTLIALTNTSGLVAKSPVVDTPIVEKGDVIYHEGPTTWTIDLPIPAGTEPGQHFIAGQLGYQICTDKSCYGPEAVSFQGAVEVGPQTVPGSVALGFDKSSYGIADKALATSVPWDGAEQVAAADGGATSLEESKNASLPLMILFSLLGGLILNVMPCVLPVIGLKILSFAEQSGQNHMKAFALNGWYSAGVMSVFLILASIAVLVGMLGKHYVQGAIFQSTPFVISMIALMFAMALSFLGVWEIPIPGFAGGGAASKLQEQEGVMGAFCKGAFATILATPCSGPMLGPVFVFAVAQPWWITYMMFGFIGLGMSAPYLLISMFPKLIAFLPKPGAWMETFKQVMAFFLLGTVVYMFYILSDRYTVAALTVVVGVWFACWLIGRTPLTATPGKRTAAWLGGMGTAVLVAVFAFRLLVPAPPGESKLYGETVKTKQTKHLTWYMYSPSLLEKASADKKTVMIDFTANWCPSCKWNMATAIDKQPIGEVVKKHDVVPLLADLSEPSEEINAKLKELQAASIPFLAIYPADRPNEPIILRDVITQQQLLDALEEANLAKPSAAATAHTAMVPAS